jgi:hypothetical protein
LDLIHKKNTQTVANTETSHDLYNIKEKDMNTVNLTPAELEMIQVKRQQEELAAKEAAAKKQLAIENEIKRVKAQVEDSVKKDTQQNAAARDFAATVAGSKVVVETNKKQRHATYGDETIKVFNYTETKVYLTLNGYTIYVNEHIVYSKWSYRGSSKGYKMYVSGPGIDYKTSNRGYKNGKKVVELIEDTIEARKAQELYKNKQRNAVETAVANLTEQFPNARINSGRGCKINPYSTPSNRYTEYDEIVVVLENGIEVKYRVYENGELSRMDLRFPNANATDLLSQLNEMNFSTETVA